MRSDRTCWVPNGPQNGGSDALPISQPSPLLQGLRLLDTLSARHVSGPFNVRSLPTMAGTPRRRAPPVIHGTHQTCGPRHTSTGWPSLGGLTCVRHDVGTTGHDWCLGTTAPFHVPEPPFEEPGAWPSAVARLGLTGVRPSQVVPRNLNPEWNESSLAAEAWNCLFGRRGRLASRRFGWDKANL